MSETRAGRLLVSFCNQAANPKPSCLLAVNVLNGGHQWVDIGCVATLVVSGVGLFRDERYLYHISIAKPDLSTVLSILDIDTFEVLNVQDLPEVSDGHSVVRLGDEILVASTGTDEVVAYRLSGLQAVEGHPVWKATGAGDDTHHVNSLAIVGGEALCSAFGPKAGQSWATARNGYIFNISRQEMVVEGLEQPHSAHWHEGQLYWCNSLLGTVDTAGGVVARLSGYSRGLAFGPDGALYAGTSVGRRRATDPGTDSVFLNPNDAGRRHGRCALVEIPPGGGSRLEVGMGYAGSEIYDILAV